MNTDHLVVDTGVLLAAADSDDQWYEQASALIELRSAEQLILPAPVAVEAAWLISTRLGPATEAAFVASLAANEFTVTDLSATDWGRCAELIDQYADLGLGLVDASVVAVAERLGIATIASIDRRDLVVVRPRHTDAFTLIP